MKKSLLKRLSLTAGFYSSHVRGLSDPKFPLEPEHSVQFLVKAEISEWKGGIQ